MQLRVAEGSNLTTEESPRKTAFRTTLRKYAVILGIFLALLFLGGLWLWRRAQPLRTFTYPTEVRNLAYSPDGALLGAICSKTGGQAFGVVLWDAQTWKPIRTLPGNVYWFWFTADGRHIVTVSSNDQRETAQAKHLEAILRKAHSRWSSQQVQSEIYDQEIQSIMQCWDAHDASPPKTVVIPGCNANGISADGRWVSFSGSANRSTIWDAETVRKVRTVASAPAPTWAVFSPDKRLLATGDIPQHIDKKGDLKLETGRQGIWNLRSGKRITALDGRVKGVLAVQFSHNGHILATETSNSLMLWDIKTWKLLHNIPTQQIIFNNYLRFCRDDQYLIGGGVIGTQIGKDARGAIQFWYVGTGKLICERKDEAFEWLSPDGRLTVSQDDVPGATTYHLHLWDTATGRLITTFPGAEEPTFAPDGNTLLTVNTRYDSPTGMQPMSFVPKQTAVFHLWRLPQAHGN